MAQGLHKGLTCYGDAGFSLVLRKAFVKAMGCCDDAVERPIGITIPTAMTTPAAATLRS